MRPIHSDVYHFGNDPDFKDCKPILPGIYAFPEFPTIDCIIYAILDNSGHICLIDAGNGRSLDAVLIAMEMARLDPAKIRSVLLTHSHPDHVFGVYRLNEYYSQLHIALPMIHAQAQLIELLQRADDASKFFLDALPGFKLSEFRIRIEPLIGNVLKEGDVFSFGDHKITVMQTPGHSRSALCFYESTKKILFSGDTILAAGGFGRYDHGFESSLQDLKHSITRLNDIHPLHLLPGHGEIILQKATDHINASWKNIISLK